jgi:hypothetical protein
MARQNLACLQITQIDAWRCDGVSVRRDWPGALLRVWPEYERQGARDVRQICSSTSCYRYAVLVHESVTSSSKLASLYSGNFPAHNSNAHSNFVVPVTAWPPRLRKVCLGVH